MIRVITLSLIFSAPDYPGAFLYPDHVRVHQISDWGRYLTALNEIVIFYLTITNNTELLIPRNKKQ